MTSFLGRGKCHIHIHMGPSLLHVCNKGYGTNVDTLW